MRSFAYLLQITTMKGTEIYPTAAVSSENTNNRAHDSESRTARQSTPKRRAIHRCPAKAKSINNIKHGAHDPETKTDIPPKRVLINTKAVGSNNNTQSARILIFRRTQGKDKRKDNFQF